LIHTRIIAGVAILAVLLVLAVPLFSFAAGTTVTVQTDSASYKGVAGTQITISGTVSPAPTASGYAISLEVNSSQGLLAVYSTSVTAGTGAFSYTMTTGYASGGWINGTYAIKAVYATSTSGPEYTATTTYQYGAVSTTTSTTPTSSSATPTTVTTTLTVSTATTVTTSLPGTTVVQPTTVVTTQTGPTTTTTTTVSNASWEYVGIGGIVAAIALAGLAGFVMMRRH
jgi:hypothetical protein